VRGERGERGTTRKRSGRVVASIPNNDGENPNFSEVASHARLAVVVGDGGDDGMGGGGGGG
jgi:hypothetical protein